MKKMSFKWLVVLCMAMGFATVAKAQIYSSEDCFYSKEGSSSVEYVVKFEYAQDRAWLKNVSHSTVRSNLAKSENFYENEVWTDGQNFVTMYEYDSYRSTSAREVYKRETTRSVYINVFGQRNGVHTYAGGMDSGHYFVEKTGDFDYVAFSKDKSTYIMWHEPKNNYDGKTENMKNYTRVPKKDLLPKAVNDDFLH